MNATTLLNNRQRYIEEMRATGRHGVRHIIHYLDRHRFFDARCSSHDQDRGGLANHCLWVLHFAHETYAKLKEERPDISLPYDSVVIACLLHNVCDCNPKGERHGSRSREIMEHRIWGVKFTKDELDAVEAYMHSAVRGSHSASSHTSETSGALLHYILISAINKAIDNANGIPFSEEPTASAIEVADGEGKPTTIRYDEEEKRYWWNDDGDTWPSALKADGMPVRQARMKALLHIRQQATRPDVAILQDEQGRRGVFSLRRLSGTKGKTLMVSDKEGFGYQRIIVYAPRYPAYRPTYLVCQKMDGKWGLISAKDQSAKHSVHPIAMNVDSEFKHDNPENIVNSHFSINGQHFHIQNTQFYQKIEV